MTDSPGSNNEQDTTQPAQRNNQYSPDATPLKDSGRSEGSTSQCDLAMVVQAQEQRLMYGIAQHTVSYALKDGNQEIVR
jgi:hypothetical protein